MKICFIAHSAKDGGAERVLLETIEAVRTRGIECFVIAPERGELTLELEQLGVQFSTISYAHWMSRKSKSLFATLKAIINIAIKTPLVAWRILRWKCDVVYTNTSTVCVGALAATLLGRRHIWHLHEFGFEDQGLEFILGERFSIAFIERLSDRCICVSKALAHKYERTIRSDKLAVIYPSMQRAWRERENAVPELSPKRFRCVIVGALIEGKGQSESVRALACLKGKNLNIELIIAGEGVPSYRRTIEALIRTNGLGGEALLIGRIASSTSLMLSADVVLVCSTSEAFGRVTVEAMFASKPVIGAASGATPELITEGFNGLLYQAGNPAELAERIFYLYENPSVAHRLGENGNGWAKTMFTMDRYSTELIAVLDEVIRVPRVLAC
jgi:glycosyltransferase involved in cell wall biosynthesis